MQVNVSAIKMCRLVEDSGCFTVAFCQWFAQTSQKGFDIHLASA